MTRRMIRISTQDGTGRRSRRWVMADVFQGLAIHPPIGSTEIDVRVITHVTSGHRVCHADNEVLAERIRDRLLERLDWTEGEAFIRQKITRAQIWEVVDAITQGTEVRHSATPAQDREANPMRRTREGT